MESTRDYYEVLGVDKDADARTIKRAFLKKARKLHPDVNKAPEAEQQFKEVNEAYSVLSDERKRANYDRYGNPEGPGGFGGDYVDMSDIFGGGFSDIFDSFFGGGRSSSGAQQRTRGRDMGISMRISLEEAAAGCRKTISYDRLAPCDDCNGSGAAEGGRVVSCSRCGGSGVVVEVQRTIFGQMQSQSVCPNCGGMGKMVDKPCETCGGQGRAPERETVEVEIPAGIHSGQSVRIEGKGEAGIRGDRAGDLVARIDILPHARYERQGDDLFCRVEIDAFDAMLGTVVSVEGIMEGETVEVKIPAGCQHDQQVSVEGMGMPRMGTKARGSVIAVVGVRIPDDLSDAERAALGKLKREREVRTRG